MRNREKKCNAAIKNVETRKKKKKDSSVLWEKMGRFHLVLFDILLEDWIFWDNKSIYKVL